MRWRACRPGPRSCSSWRCRRSARYCFVWDMMAGVVGLPRRPLSWRMREMMEMGASIGLVLGVALGAVLLFTTLPAKPQL